MKRFDVISESKFEHQIIFYESHIVYCHIINIPDAFVVPHT